MDVSIKVSSLSAQIGPLTIENGAAESGLPIPLVLMKRRQATFFWPTFCTASDSGSGYVNQRERIDFPQGIGFQLLYCRIDI